MRYFAIVMLAATLPVLSGAPLDSVASAQKPRLSQRPENPDKLGPNRLSPLMRMKLERSKNILEGLALEEFEKISTNAQALSLLSLESGWNVVQTEEYATQSRDFRRTTKIISDAAKEKDLGRASMGFVALTVRCVECHSYMRKNHPTLAKHNSVSEKK